MDKPISDCKINDFSLIWARNRIVDSSGTGRRLLKLRGPADHVSCFRLLDMDGALLDEAVVPPGFEGNCHCGFWVPETLIADGNFILQCVGPAASARYSVVVGQPGQGDELPLRLDRTGKWLRHHLNTREQMPPAKALADFVPGMENYLHQHRIIYQRPATHWNEGLPLGNGTVGVTVVGEPWQTQAFYLDRNDLWAATQEGRPIGRVYAGYLTLRARTANDRQQQLSADFLQELSLYRAEVVTRSHSLTTRARVNAVSGVIEITINWDGQEPLQVEIELTRPATPLLNRQDIIPGIMNGSWHAIHSKTDIANTIHIIEQSPHTNPEVEIQGDTALLRHVFPNMKYAVAVGAGGTSIEWKNSPPAHGAGVTGAFNISACGKVAIFAVIESDHVGGDKTNTDPAQEALARLEAARAEQRQIQSSGNNDRQDEHCAWWHDFWQRSFVELPDKLMENLWYFGAYHQASFSRSLQAPGFFALWHPLDYRTWDDNFTTDAQTSLMWWAPFATNHLELMLPSHHTFSRLLLKFMEYHAGPGARVAGGAYPAFAGGHSSFYRDNPYKGSTAWFALNFWWDYLFTLDREFLASIAYPVISACADLFTGCLIKGKDGRWHCPNSSAPEQDNTESDNTYDWACIKSVLKAAVESAMILGVDRARSAAWQKAWNDLFTCPADDQSLLETPVNPHPYRCHPVVLFGIHPTGSIEPGSELWQKANNTYDIVTNLFGFHFQDRHAAIPGHAGGVEPNGHATAFLMHSAARLKGWQEVRRLFYALMVRCQLKRNGLRSICDPRHDAILCNMAISEATSGQTSGLSETFVQNYSDHVRVFPGPARAGVFRFAGLRAYGGFILAAEYADGLVRRLTVHSLRGGVFRLLNPWPGRTVTATPPCPMRKIVLADGSEGLELITEPGSIFRLQSDVTGHEMLPAPVIEERHGPRAVSCGDWDEYDPPAVYYPCDLPYAQGTQSDVVYLGMPREEPVGQRHLDWNRVTALANDQDWRARQTAARCLARFPTEDATRLLAALAMSDTVPVIAYTAGVSLVVQGTAQGLAEAMKIARLTPRSHLRREIIKAVTRSAHSEQSLNLPAGCFSNLENLENAIGNG